MHPKTLPSILTQKRHCESKAPLSFHEKRVHSNQCLQRVHHLTGFDHFQLFDVRSISTHDKEHVEEASGLILCCALSRMYPEKSKCQPSRIDEYSRLSQNFNNYGSCGNVSSHVSTFHIHWEERGHHFRAVVITLLVHRLVQLGEVFCCKSRNEEIGYLLDYFQDRPLWNCTDRGLNVE